MTVTTRLAAAVATLSLLVPSLAAAGEPTAAPAKSEGGALFLAVGGTLAGLGLSRSGQDQIERGDVGSQVTGYGLLAVSAVAPSLGHLYAGDHRRAVISSGVRAAGLAAFVVGTRSRDTGLGCGIDRGCDGGGGGDDGNLMLALAGAGVIVGTTIYDLVDAPRAARRANAHALTLTPAALPAKGGPAPGLSLSGRF